MHKLVLYSLSFLNKGFEVSFLLFLPFLQKDLSISIFEIGLISTVFVIMQILNSYYAGTLAKRFSNSHLILLAITLYCVSWLILGFTNYKEVLYIIMILAGGACGIFDTIANSLVAKNSTSENRTKQIANFGSAGDLGRVSVSFLASIAIAYFNWHIAAFLFLVLSIIGLISFYFNQPKEVEDVKKIEEIDLHIKQILKNVKFSHTLLIGFMDSFSSSSLFIFLAFILTAKGLDTLNSNMYVSIFFVGYLSGRLILGHISDKFNKANVLIFAEVSMALILVSIILFSNFYVILLLVFLLGVFARGTSPIIKSMVADTFDSKSQFEKYYGTYIAASRTGSSVSRPVYGFVATFLGTFSIFYTSAIIATLSVIPILILKLLKKSK